MNDPSDTPLRKDLLKLLVASLLGAGLTFLFQTLQARNDRFAATVAADRENATHVFEEVSQLIGERIVRESKATLRKPMPLLVTDSAWEVNYDRNRALICRYFGPELSVLYGRDIATQFEKRALVFVAIARGDSLDRKALEQFSAEDRLLSEDIYKLNNQMIEKIRTGKFATTSRSKCDSIPMASYTPNVDSMLLLRVRAFRPDVDSAVAP